MSGACSPLPGEPFWFAHISDLQPVDSEDEASVQALARALATLDEGYGFDTLLRDFPTLEVSSLAFTLVAGDLTATTSADEWDFVRTTLEGAGVRMHYVLGNHDLYQWQNTNTIVDYVEGQESDALAFYVIPKFRAFGYSERVVPRDVAYGFTFGGVTFSGIANDDRQWTKARAELWHVTHSTDWLKEQSWWDPAQSGDLGPRVLFMHYPFGCNLACPDWENDPQAQQDLKDALRETNVFAVLAGHTHHSDLDRIDDVNNFYGYGANQIVAGTAKVPGDNAFWIYKAFPGSGQAFIACRATWDPSSESDDAGLAVDPADCHTL